MSENELQRIRKQLKTISQTLMRAIPPAPAPIDYEASDAFIWNAGEKSLNGVQKVNRVDITLLKGIDHVKEIFLKNTWQFAQNLNANNVLLWGARGMGKSSLIKAAHAHINAELAKKGKAGTLKLIEIHREDIESLPTLMVELSKAPYLFILFCDDLSFDHDDTSYKSLKAALDGGLEGRPDNVIFYATSNRRHLLPRDMMENERSTAINPSEAVEEKVSLSDRFGLWLGFHKCSQEEFLTMVDGYCEHFGLKISKEERHQRAIEWYTTRGSRSGRVAWQLIQTLAGELGQKI